MPRLSLWKDEHSDDFRFFDRTISEMFTVGGTGINVHKYLGTDDEEDPRKIQDLIFLENRDRRYAKDIYSLRGVYNVADNDFDLSQFGLFLQNDTIFVTFHLGDMINAIGRKLISGDVFELPHLTDYHSLDQDMQSALRRYYVIQEGTRPSEGFSPTWYPHLWRVKCMPLVDSQEYSDILNTIQTDSSTGEETEFTLRDLLSTYRRELEISDAVVDEAEKHVPKSGYDISKYYTIPIDSDGNPDTSLTPAASGYEGYLVGDGLPPNGHPVTMAIAFPESPNTGDYVLRMDSLPNRLYRFDGVRWVHIEDNVRNSLTPGIRNTQLDSFFNAPNSGSLRTILDEDEGE